MITICNPINTFWNPINTISKPLGFYWQPLSTSCQPLIISSKPLTTFWVPMKTFLPILALSNFNLRKQVSLVKKCIDKPGLLPWKATASAL
jgi:hypothetical protein